MATRYGTEDDPRDTDTLIDFAVRAKTRDASAKCLRALMFRDPETVFSAAKAQCERKRLRERIIGVELASRTACASAAHSRRAWQLLTRMLKPGTSVEELRAVLRWISNCSHTGNVVGLSKVRALAQHPDPTVRLHVARVLGIFEDSASIKTLLRLMSDSSPRVRDWATFAIGELCPENSARIRNALAERLQDNDEETFAEAVYGLAKRNDKRGFAAVQAELDSGEPSSMIIRAAAEFGRGRYTATLRRLLRVAKHDDGIYPPWLSALKWAVKESIASNK
jgi:hypothetical protein